MSAASSRPASEAMSCCRALALATAAGPYFWLDRTMRSVSTARTVKATSASPAHRLSNASRNQAAARAPVRATADSTFEGGHGRLDKAGQESKSTRTYRRTGSALERDGVASAATGR